MAITPENGRFKLDIYPAGRSGPRIVRRYDTRKEAKLKQAEFVSLYAKAPDQFQKDKRKLSTLVKLWYQLHGSTLKDHKYRYSRTLALCENLGDPSVYKFSGSDFARYREKQLKLGKSKSTLNHELRYLRAVFSELIRLDCYSGNNPLSKIRAYKIPKSKLTFLTFEQLDLLLLECQKSTNTHLYPVVLLALATGARFTEANSIKRSDLLNDRVVYTDTKNGHNRVVPVNPDLIEYLLSVAYPVPYDRLFDSCKGAFRSAVDRSGIELPEGQLTHILRHTFASHYVMDGGSLKALQEILGHEDIKTTMIYAHLAPDYLNSVLTLGVFPRLCSKNVVNIQA